MFVVFVLFLFIPLLIAMAAGVHAALRGGLAAFDAYHAVKTLLFFVPFAWLVLKPGHDR